MHTSQREEEAEGLYVKLPVAAWGRFLGKKRQTWQVVAVMITFLAWAIFIILFALVWSSNLDLFQNIVILFGSFVAAAAVGGGVMALGTLSHDVD